MSLDVNRIVGVSISVSPLALQRAGFGIMNIVGSSDVIPLAERVRAYSSITEVADDFATSDGEYAAASIYFSQTPRPSVVYISRRDHNTETIQESLNAIEAVNSKWYGFGFTDEVRENSKTLGAGEVDCIEAAMWAEARTKTFWNNTADANTLVTGNTTSISYLLSEAGYRRTATVYSMDDYPALSLFARGATVDYSGTNTTIDYAFKQLPGITPEDLSSSQANAAGDVNCNYYANFGTQLSGDSVAMVWPGDMASGVAIDEVIGIDWLQNSLQTDVFNYLYQNTTKTPQTDEGVAGIAQVMEVALSQAVANGLAAPGYVTIDNEEVFLPKGYYIQTGLIEDQSQASREAREAPPISFVIKGAGSIRNVQINGTFVR